MKKQILMNLLNLILNVEYNDSFVKALAFEEASKLYDEFCEELRSQFGKIELGSFGADMKISFTNDGPFTLMLDTKDIWGL